LFQYEYCSHRTLPDRPEADNGILVTFWYNERRRPLDTDYTLPRPRRRRRRPSIWRSVAGCLGRLLIYLVALVIIAALALLVYIQARSNPSFDRPAAELTAPSDAATVMRGEFIVKFAAQCWRCHGAPEAADRNEDAPLSGGRALDLSRYGPGFATLPLGLGTYYAANITPDPDTGIGRWTDGEIVRALREGISRDGRLLFPIMPHEWLHGMSDDDALAVVAYLRSQPPVRNAVPGRQPSLAARGLFAFNRIQPTAPISGTISAPPPGATAEYGAYLANHVALCASCHTPRDPQTWQPLTDQPMAGSLFPIPVADDGTSLYALNITSGAERGIGDWSEEDFIRAMREGVTPQGHPFDPAMPRYAQLSADELRAIYLYLRSLP
jgi:cytochrome c553